MLNGAVTEAVRDLVSGAAIAMFGSAMLCKRAARFGVSDKLRQGHMRACTRSQSR
jgi:hypothetical protein